MRKRTLRIGMSAAYMTALIGCGSISGLVPDQTVRDPLKLNNVGIRATVGGTRVIARAEKLAGPFPNMEALPATPRTFRIEEPLRSLVRIGGEYGTAPPSLTLSDIKMTITIVDTDGTVVELPPAVLAGPIFCPAVPETPGDYSLSLGPYTIVLDVTDQKHPLLQVLTRGGENTINAVFELDIASTPTLPDGSNITFWFEEGRGVATF